MTLKHLFYSSAGSIILWSCADAQKKENSTYIPVDEFSKFEEIVREEILFAPKTFENTAQNAPASIIHGLEDTSFHFYNAAAFATEQKGVLVGGAGMRIRSTLDGGQTWKDIRFSRFANTLHSAAIKDGQAFAVGEGSYILKSDTTLSDWSVFDLKNLEGLKGDSQTLYKIKFLGDLGFVMGLDTGLGISNPIILKTLDGGDNWTVALATGLESETGAITDFDIVSEKLVYLVSQMGNAYKSENGGSSWTEVFTPLQKFTNLNSIAFKDELTGFISGTMGLLYFTKDGGKNWTQNTIFKDSTNLNISDIKYINDDTVAITTAESFIVAEKQVFSYLIDGNGQNETPIPLLTKKDSTIFFKGDSFYLFLMDSERLFLTDRNNVYSLDVKDLGLD